MSRSVKFAAQHNCAPAHIPEFTPNKAVRSRKNPEQSALIKKNEYLRNGEGKMRANI